MKTDRRGWFKRALGLGVAAAMTRLMPEKALGFGVDSSHGGDRSVLQWATRDYAGNWSFVQHFEHGMTNTPFEMVILKERTK